MKQFEIPELKIVVHSPRNIISTSSEEPTDQTGGGEVTTPPDDFPDD